MHLSEIRRQIVTYCDALLDEAGLFGSYRMAPRLRADLYSACDVVLMRTIMGEDLPELLSDGQRAEYIEHINSFAFRDGTYTDTRNHHPLHANGQTIGALGVLGGRQPYPVRLYADFDSPERVVSWLEKLDWSAQWDASHLFWGGLHCFSFSSRCTPKWRGTVLAWLDSHLDPHTGWWCAGTKYTDRCQPLGGAAHIYPIYQHHDHPFPYPQQVIDSTLALQQDDGRWSRDDEGYHFSRPMSYLELDALYALLFMQSHAPEYRRDDIHAAVTRYAGLCEIYWRESKDELLSLHPHEVLSAVGIFGLFQRLLPGRFTDEVAWTDIFSDRRFYRTNAVECVRSK